MKLLSKFLLTLTCAATIFSCGAMTPEQQERINRRLIDASRLGNLQAVQQALAAGADIHAQADLALRYSAKNGDLLIVRYLVQHGANIHANNDMALRSTSFEDHLDVVQFLIEQGANIHAENNSTVRWAVRNRNWSMVAYLLKHGADRSVLRRDELSGLSYYILTECKTSLRNDEWHRVEELLSAVVVHELPLDIQQPIRAILVPAVQKKLNSACWVLPITPTALRTLSFIVGPKTAAAFIYFIKENTHEITQ